MKVLVVLNDGTDEVFNLHSYTVTCKEQVLYELGNTFITGGLLADAIENGDLDLENQYYDIFDLLVKEFVLDIKYFMLVDTTFPPLVHEQVDKQNEICKHLFNVEDFVPWDKVKDKL